MSDRILERIHHRFDDTSAKRLEEGEATDDYRVFGWLRGVRDRALMLELRLRNGNIICLGYPWLERIDFDPSEGVTLNFGRTLVRLIGTDLDEEIRPNVKLIAGIIRHRVPWIQESGLVDQMQGIHAMRVDEIRVQYGIAIHWRWQLEFFKRIWAPDQPTRQRHPRFDVR